MLPAWEKEQLHRTAWRSFPDVTVFASERLVKQHALYLNAKEGDARAAEAVVCDAMASADLDKLREVIGLSKPFLLPVHAIETAGMNAIPRTFARFLGHQLNLPVHSGVVQVNRVTHTGAGGDHRLAFPAVFGGEVAPVPLLLVDDFIGQGGTLANLRGYAELQGGKVIAATSLTGKQYSAKLRPDASDIEELRKRHGNRLEEWWIATFGYGFEKLTRSEVRYLGRIEDADSIPNRLALARRSRN